MKHFTYILLLTIGTQLFFSCTKVKTARDFPDIADGNKSRITAAEIAWLEQMAQHDRDSIRIADSISAVTGVVDTNSLFHKKNMMIAIVEVNDHLFANVNCYKDQNGKPLFDLAFPFSANMNIDPATGKAYVFYNPQHQAMIRLGVFDQVRNAGVPVGLSILGNHDDAGWSNFKTLEDATAFAQIVAREVRQKKFAAVLSDDEYSNSVSGAHPASYVMVMSEIKRLLPATYLCYYRYGGGATPYNGKKMGDAADVAFGAFYPEYPSNAYLTTYGFPKSKWFPSCSETDGGFADPAATVAQAKADGLGGFMFYNVWGRANSPGFYSPYVTALKGKTLTVANGCLNPNQQDFINGQ